jgi:hypothetical protein
MIKTRNQGFHLTFENGWTISVQIGALNYCGDYPDNEMDRNDYTKLDSKPCQRINAEIAYWQNDGPMESFEDGDTVKGWVSPDEIAEWIYKIKNK